MQNTSLTFVVDSHIPFIREPLARLGDVRVLAPADIDAAAVADADALLVRTRTRCDAALLAHSKVRFAGTATIGFDHIDRDWCEANGIRAVNAPGCNAPAVAQYVFATLARLINRPLTQYTLGIVGVGHVGSIVERWARAMGMRVLLCDPPRQQAEGGDGWSTLHDIAVQADIVTFHTPLTRDGDCPTFHLADRNFFRSLRRAPVIINAARGPVVDTQALIDAIRDGIVGPTIIDTWEGEPSISRELLGLVDIATPHIAGYSLQGKIRATAMVLDELCRFFGVERPPLGVPEPPQVPDEVTLAAVAASYDPMTDDRALRRHPDSFERLRDEYDLRDEVPAGRNV